MKLKCGRKRRPHKKHRKDDEVSLCRLKFVCLDEEDKKESNTGGNDDNQSDSDVGSVNNGLMVVLVVDKERQSHLKRELKQDACSSNIGDPERKKKTRWWKRVIGLQKYWTDRKLEREKTYTEVYPVTQYI